MMVPNRAKLEMLGQRIGQRRDATRALTQVPTGWGSFGCPTNHTVGQKAVNPRGMGTASPFQKSSFLIQKKTLTKGGESPSRRPTHDLTSSQGMAGVGRGTGPPG